MRLRSLFVTAVTLLFSTAAFAGYRVAAWIPPWDSAALTSMQQHAGSLDESNPVWYSMSSSGAIVANWNAENATWLAAMTGTRITPTLQNVVNGSFDANVAVAVLSASSRDAHAQAITDLVLSKGYDGIDIDYERVPTTSRADFTAFISVLSTKLHAMGKKLSVTVYAKTSDAQNWNGPGAQDWIALGGYADSIKIMAYDYHWSTSAAGDITPLTWLDQVTTYAESAIPAAKVMVGLPWYGYDWNGSTGTGIVYSQAIATATNNFATIGHDADGEATFTYGGTHTVYFQDAAAYQRKTDMLRQKHPNIGGLATWRTGGEDPGFWPIVDAARGGSTTTTPPPPPPPAPTVAPDFTVSGPATMSVRAAKSDSASYSITRVGGLTAAVAVTATKVSAFDGTLSLSASTLSGSTSATTLRVSTTRATVPGTYQVALTFTSGSLVHQQTVTVTVTSK